MLNYITKKLENGVKCYIVPKKGYAEKKAMIAFNYGSCNTEFIYNGKTIKQTKGIAHFLEHKMFDGSADIFSEFEKLGASANAFTNFTTTAYHFNCTENFEKAFELLMKMVSSLDTTEESVEREKKIIGQEIKMYNDDIGWQVYFNGLKCAYSDNNVRYSVAGTLESIEDINCEDLYTAYKAFYTADNCCIIVVGDVDENNVLKLANENLHLGEKCAEKITKQEDEINNDIEKIEKNIPKNVFNIDFREDIETNDIAYRIALNEVMLEILCGKSSHLYNKLNYKGLISSELTADYLCGNDYGLRIICGESNNIEEILSEISQEVERYVTFGVSDKNLKRVVKAVKNKNLFGNESLENICSVFADCFTKGIEVLDIYAKYDIIKNNDIREELKTFSRNNRVLSVVGG